MLDIIFNLFKTLIHGIQIILNIIISIPSYISLVLSYLSTLPAFMLAPLTIALIAVVIISIKRLVIS